MAAYVASGRIGRATPRLVTAATARELDLRALSTSTLVAHDSAILAEADGRAVEPEPTTAERWAEFRERWSQMTFYLFDANSWR